MNRDWKFYGGHTPYGIHKLDTDFGSKYVYVTLLRDPIDHACSYYKDSMRWHDLIKEGKKPSKETIRRARLAKENSLEDFFSYEENQNLQTRMLSGILMYRIGKYINLNDSLIGKIYLHLSKSNLNKKYRVVGETSNMKDFFEDVSEELGMEFKKVEVSNRFGGGNYEENITESQIKKVKSYNSLDFKLYNGILDNI